MDKNITNHHYNKEFLNKNGVKLSPIYSTESNIPKKCLFLIIFISIYHQKGSKSRSIKIKVHMKDIQNEHATLTLTATTPTHDLDDPEYILSLIKVTNYQVIPCHPASLAYDIDNILLKVLSAKEYKDVLIDLALPYRYQPPGQPMSTYFGRYIIFNQIVQAIRLASAPSNTQQNKGKSNEIKKWTAGERTYHQLPHIVQKFYKEQNLGNFKDVLVGDFTIKFKGIQIALLFESQLASMPKSLIQSCDNGCSILSVINDEPRLPIYAQKLTHKTYGNQSPCENQLIHFGRNRSQVIIYCGMRMATINSLYLANTFIGQAGKLKEERKSLFTDGSTISLAVTLPILLSEPDERVRDITSSFTTVFKPITNERTSVEPAIPSNFTNLRKSMQIWYLYKQINKGTPFVISLPMSQQCKQLFKQITKISNFLKLPLPAIVSLYKNKQDYIPTREQSSNLFIYQNINVYINTCHSKHICIYSEDAQELEYLSTLVVFYRKKLALKLCHNFLSQYRHRQQNVIRKLAENMVLNSQLDMKSFVLQARQKKLNNQNLKQLMRMIKDNLRRSPVITPFFHYVINSNDQDLQTHMQQCELQLVAQRTDMFRVEQKIIEEINQKQPTINQYIMISEDEEVNAHPNKNPQLTFLKKLGCFKRFQQKQQKCKDICCHSCALLMTKQMSFNCQQCQSRVCYPCIEKTLLNNPPKLKEDYQICIVCKKFCNCKKCMKDIINILMPKQEVLKKEDMNINKICQTCKFEQRRQMQIKLICESCKELSCYLCQQSKGKINLKRETGVTQRWMCLKCKHSRYIFKQVSAQTTIQGQSMRQPHFQQQQQKRQRTRDKQSQQKKQRNSFKFFLDSKNKKRRHSSSSSSGKSKSKSKNQNQNKKQKYKKSRSRPRSKSRSKSKSNQNHHKKGKNNNNYIKNQNNHMKFQASNSKMEYKHIPIKKQVKIQAKSNQKILGGALWGQKKSNPEKKITQIAEKPNAQKMDVEERRYFDENDECFKY